MPFSKHALDMIATHLSEFKNPDIPPLTLRDDKTLQNNMLERVLGAVSGKGNAHARHLITNRRVFASIETYRLGRTAALDYTSGGRNEDIRPYFLALTYFESSVSYSWQTADFMRRLGGHDVFKPGDGSAWERLHAIYSEGVKHSFGQYDAIARPEMPTTVWLTNSGIACVSGESITYRELSEVIAANNALFYDIQKKVVDRRRAATHQGQQA